MAARRFAGLMERSSKALVAALWPLTVGHLLAMFVVMLPFALLVALVAWQQQIQIGASLLVIGFGIFRFVNRRHPRVLARIRPAQLGLWSFAVAIAHGAGLMLVPIYLGLCQAAGLDEGHQAVGALINANLGMAVLVSVVHSVAMIGAGGFWRGWSTATWVSSSCRGAGSIWMQLGPSVSSCGRSIACDQPSEFCTEPRCDHSGPPSSVALKPVAKKDDLVWLMVSPNSNVNSTN